MNPSVLRMRATSILSFEEGSSMRSWCDVMPLRIRVSMSAMGSVIDIRMLLVVFPPVLPARFGHTRDVSAERQLPETDAAELKLAQKAARTAAHLAAVHFARRVLRFPRRFDDH